MVAGAICLSRNSFDILEGEGSAGQSWPLHWERADSLGYAEDNAFCSTEETCGWAV